MGLGRFLWGEGVVRRDLGYFYGERKGGRGGGKGRISGIYMERGWLAGIRDIFIRGGGRGGGD